MGASAVTDRQDNPAADHEDVQYDADRENRYHAASTRGRGTPSDDPHLVEQRRHSDDKKNGLQALEHEQAASGQERKYAKSSLDLREYSSTWSKQSGDDGQPSRPLWTRIHGIPPAGIGKPVPIVPSRGAAVKETMRRWASVRRGG
jgi:hypothetical protein